VIKYRKMRMAEHVARMEERRGEMHTRFCWKTLTERDHLEYPGVDGSIILTLILLMWRIG